MCDIVRRHVPRVCQRKAQNGVRVAEIKDGGRPAGPVRVQLIWARDASREVAGVSIPCMSLPGGLE